MLSLSKNYTKALFFCIIKEKGAVVMEEWKRDTRKEVVITDLDALVPQDHLL